MNKIFLAGAALGALTVGAQAADYNPITAKPALQTVSGDLALYGGFGTISSVGGSESDGGFSTIGGLARANVWLTPTVSAQFDLGAEDPFAANAGNYGVVDLAAHLSSRGPGGLLGVFGSVGYNGYWGSRVGTIGLEGQTYMGPFQLYGQLGGTFTFLGNSIQDYYVIGEARYFLNPNLMLSANLGFDHLTEAGESEGHNNVRWGLGLEAKMANSPFGGFISYQGFHDSEVGSPSDNFTVHTFLAGIKVHINNATVQSEMMAGSTLVDMNAVTGVNHGRFQDLN